ncbi:hypothetical protein [Candidatus Ornithobacterium hominis]|uniref:hypothetical protein n=1 Tax=Candidatus Ornithobacterium hominis TaxID=2497989 RepID=UPI0024BD519B|nr:hypothetical protein [Candidatus Ornithobacterium hominis]
MKNLLYILLLIFSITFGYAQEVVAQDLRVATIDYVISDIKYVASPPPGKIIIEGNAGEGNANDTGSGTSSQEELPGGKDYTLTDAKGNVWAVDEEGNITNVGMQAKGGASTPQNTAGVDAKGNATTITAEGIRVTFKNSSDSKYAFDQPTKALNSDYKELNGKLIPFKAVENKKTEPFIASVEIIDSSVSVDGLIFKTSKGVPIAAEKVGNDYRLTLKGLYSFAGEEVQAVIKQGDKYKIAGVFNLVHISPKRIKLNLIPTTGVSISGNQIQKVKDIYKKIAIDVDISVKETFDITPYLVNGKLPTEDAFGDLSSYSSAQNEVIKAYKQEQGVDLAYYIFVTDKPSSNRQAGYMRLGGQFGFVYDQQARTIAHELGHGALRLEHPFKEFDVAQGEVKNLMDYDTNNTNFIYPDWKQVNDPKFKIYAFQGQSEGELVNLDVREHLRKLRLYYKYNIHFNISRYSRTGGIKKGVDFFDYKVKDLVLIYYKKEGLVANLSLLKSEKYSNFYNKLMYQIKIGNVGEINCLSKEDRDVLYDFITEENFKYMPQNTVTIEEKKTYSYNLIYNDLEEIKASLIKKNTYNSLSSNEKLLLDLPLIMWSKKWEYGSIFMYNWFMEEGDINMDKDLYKFLDNWKELKEMKNKFYTFIEKYRNVEIKEEEEEENICFKRFEKTSISNRY